jgi:hypothetical protein
MTPPDTSIDPIDSSVTEESMTVANNPLAEHRIDAGAESLVRGPDSQPGISTPADEPREPMPADDPRTDELLAQSVRGMASGLYFYGAAARIFPQLKTTTCITYVQDMVEDCGDPRDPLERLLVEQLIQIHHAAGRLLVKAEHAGAAEASSLLIASAARMFSEYRKGLQTLRTLRQAPATPAQVTVYGNVGQQCVAGGPQQVSMVRHEAEGTSS